MGKAFTIFFGTTVIFVVLLAGNALAAIQTVQVVAPGGTPCVATAQYPTIQQAVNSVTAGSTIIVCPGAYAEQVTITKNLTLRGENTGSGSGATIAAPSGGVLTNASDLGELDRLQLRYSWKTRPR
jgi:pectin methylesterase-like acyl-CoA thioesterase